MSLFTDADRAFHTEMRSLTTNSKGEEVLVGLTLEETEFYMKYSKQCMDGTENHKDADKYLELHDKHEKVRLSILSAEIQMRTDNPQCH